MNATSDDGLSAHRTRTNRWPDPLHAPAALIVRADSDARSYFPKIRGSMDYGVCAVPAAAV